MVVVVVVWVWWCWWWWWWWWVPVAVAVAVVPMVVVVVAGCRGPELACNEVLGFCDKLLAEGASDILLKFGQPLGDADKHILLSDFEQGRRQLMFYLTVKLGAWGQLPLKLVGIAHHNEDMAREAAAKALLLYSGYGDSYRHHAVSALLLDGDNREQMQRFAAGVARAELPVVQRWASKFMFIMTNERWIEGLHAKIHGITLAHKNATHATVGLALHSSYLREFIASSAENFKALVCCFDQTRTPMSAVRALGLASHPAVQTVVQQTDSVYSANRGHRNELVDVIYHADAPTLFLTHPLMKPDHRGGGPVSTEREEILCDDHFAAVVAKYAIQHFKDRELWVGPDLKVLKDSHGKEHLDRKTWKTDLEMGLVFCSSL